MSINSITAVCAFKDAVKDVGIFVNAMSTENFSTTVVVDYGNETVTYNDMVVSLSDYGNWVNVNINWEDSGAVEYRKLGLFGYYSTGYCKMYFDESKNALTIESTNDVTITVYVPS